MQCHWGALEEGSQGEPRDGAEESERSMVPHDAPSCNLQGPVFRILHVHSLTRPLPPPPPLRPLMMTDEGGGLTRPAGSSTPNHRLPVLQIDSHVSTSKKTMPFNKSSSEQSSHLWRHFSRKAHRATPVVNPSVELNNLGRSWHPPWPTTRPGNRHHLCSPLEWASSFPFALFCLPPSPSIPYSWPWISLSPLLPSSSPLAIVHPCLVSRLAAVQPPFQQLWRSSKRQSHVSATQNVSISRQHWRVFSLALSVCTKHETTTTTTLQDGNKFYICTQFAAKRKKTEELKEEDDDEAEEKNSEKQVPFPLLPSSSSSSSTRCWRKGTARVRLGRPPSIPPQSSRRKPFSRDPPKQCQLY